MSLLFLDDLEQDATLAQRIFERQFANDPLLAHEYDGRRRRSMLHDIAYNLKLLRTAVDYDANGIMVDYARWIFQLLRYRMPDIPVERIRDQMVQHYRLLQEEASRGQELGLQVKIRECLAEAIDATHDAVQQSDGPTPDERPNAALRAKYVELVLAAKRSEATDLILAAVDQGTSLMDLYLNVFQEAMYTVGRYWHEGKITVDKEHYFTAMTQSIMTRLYPRIFSTPRVGKTILAACVGRELHEMGIRMLCDLFEVHGWDSVYLGSALPEDAILHGVSEHNPNLLALSVTMPHHLEQAESLIRHLRQGNTLSRTKIAVGGRAIQVAPHLAEAWGADVTAPDAITLLQWADDNVIGGN